MSIKHSLNTDETLSLFNDIFENFMKELCLSTKDNSNKRYEANVIGFYVAK